MKGYFKKGDIPTEEQFAELIDSTLNLVEDEQVIRTDTGWAFYPTQDGNLDIGFYTEKSATGTKLPVWSLSVTPEKKLVIKNGQTEVVMEAAQDKSFLLHGNLMVEETVTASAYKTKGGGGVTPGEELPDRPCRQKVARPAARTFPAKVSAAVSTASTLLSANRARSFAG